MKNQITSPVLICIPILIGIGGVISMSLIAYLLQNETLPMWVISQHKVINFTFTMQFMVLPISFVAMALLYLHNREKFKTFLNIKIKRNTTNETDWSVLGILLAVIFTAGTTVFMAVSVSSQNGAINGSFFKLLPLVFLFAATNAWSEEIFSRFVIVAGLHGKVKPSIICWISAILFGLPHFIFGAKWNFRCDHVGIIRLVSR